MEEEHPSDDGGVIVIDRKFAPDLIVAPFELLSDERLTLRHIRTLLAIFSWRKKNTSVARVSREMLSERTGYPLSRISTLTTELEQMGWLKKTGNGGKSQWSEYQICDIENTVNSYQNSNRSIKLNNNQNGNGYQFSNGYQNGNQTVTDLDSNGYQFGNDTVTNSVRGIDTGIVQEELKTGRNTGREEREEIAVLTASVPEATAPTFSQAESLPTTNRQQPAPPQAKVSMEVRSLTAELHRDTAKRVPGFTPKFSNYADETAIAELIANGATADHIRKVWAFATNKPFWAGKIATPKDLTRHWVALCQESANAKPPTASQQQAMRNGKPIIDREGWTAAAGEGWYTSWGTKEGWHDGKMYENDCEMMGVAA